MTTFTPGSALLGGALIGLSAGILMLGLGRVAGVSGVLGSALRGSLGEQGWRIAFLAGLVVGPLIGHRAGLALPVPPDAGWPLLILGGLLVGFGTQLGSGCTSGHGVCGIAQLSPRSLAATGVFMAAGMAVVFLVRRVIGG